VKTGTGQIVLAVALATAALVSVVLVLSGSRLATDTWPGVRVAWAAGDDVAIGTPLLDEGFEDGILPPTGWQAFAYSSAANPDYGWYTTSVITYVRTYTYSAYHGDIPGGVDAESWLVTPLLTPTTSSELVFWQYEEYPDFYYRHSIWVSWGSPDPKENEYVFLAEVGPGLEKAWQEVRLDLSAYAGRPIYIAFRYESGPYGAGADKWAVDDVLVTTELVAVNDGPTLFGNTTTLTASVGTGTDIVYQWDPGDGSGLLAGQTITHVYPAASTYTAVVTASNGLGAVTATTTVLVEDPVSGLVAGNDGPTVLEAPTTLSATVTAGSNVAYTWDLDGSSGSEAVITHTYATPGVYTALVTATNSVSVMTTTTEVVVDEVVAGLSALNDGPTPLGELTALTATVTAGSNVAYTWDLDGSSGSGAVVAHTYTTPGVHTALVTATNSVSVMTATTEVVVDEIVAGLTAVNDGPTPLGELTVLGASVTAGSSVVYTWDFGDGTTGDGVSVVHTYAAVGAYTAVVTASNSVSWITATTEVVVNEVVTGLNADNDGPTSLGEPTALTATVTAGSNVAYTWDFGDGSVGTGAIVSHTYAAPGEYEAVVTATNSVGVVTATTAVLVEEPVSALAATNDGPTALGGATTLSAGAAGSNVAYTWDFGDGATGGGAVVAHTYPGVGVYTAVVTASNSVSWMTATTKVQVEEPVSGLAAADNSYRVLGQVSTLTATVTAGSNVEYMWDLGDGSVGTGAVVSHAYAAPGEYEVVVTATNSVSWMAATTSITVHEPVAGLTAANDGPTALGQSTALTATVSVGTDVSYVWDFGDGSTGSGAVVAHSYPEAGVYTAVVTATDPVSAISATTTVAVEEAMNSLTVLTDGPTALGQATTFTVSVDSGSNLLFSWDLGDGAQGSAYGDMEVVIVRTYEAVGRYTALFTATNPVEVFSKSVDIYVDVPVALPLLDEGLEDTIPPDGWTVYSSLAAGPQWQQAADRRHSGEYSVFHDDLHGDQDSWLVSPQLVPAVNSQLLFWQNENYTWVHHYHAIWVSTGSGDPKDNEFFEWTELPPGAEDTWEQVTLDLGEFAERPIYIAFRYQGDYADEWYLDDVRVTAPLTSVSNGTVVWGEPSVFTASVRNGTNISYTWDFGDGTEPVTSTASVISHVYSLPGYYTATVGASNSVNETQANCEAAVKAVLYLPLFNTNSAGAHPMRGGG